MRKMLALLLGLSLLFTCSAFAEESTAALPTKDIVVLFTSDAHCGVTKGFGYTGVAAVRDQLVKSGCYVTLVDNGDAIQGEPIGTLSTGEAIIDLMNTVGYDLAIPGNHEFDYGMDRFLELVSKANFPYLSCNFTKNDELVFDAYRIMDYDGVKIAYVGITTPKTITSSTPTYFQDENGNYIYSFMQGTTGDTLYASVQQAVDAARAEGADYVVAMAHLGIAEETSPWMSTEVIANTTGIDALLDGHSHSELEQEKVLNKDGNEVLLAACGTKLANIGVLRLSTDGTLSTELYKWGSSVNAADLFGLTGPVQDAVLAASDALSAELDTVVAKTDVDLIMKEPGTDIQLVRAAETNLGDLCADAYRAMSGADVAFVNGGGIRTNIEAGDITYGEILSVHPFGNALCTVEATGQQILDALEMGSRKTPGVNGGFLQVSGLTYEIHTYLPSTVQLDENGLFKSVDGEYRVKNVMVGDESLDLEKTYIVASHNYMLKSGGDGLNMFINDPIVLDEVMLDNQTLIKYITEVLGGVVGAEYSDIYGQGRIVAVDEAPAK
ncbi:MAG: bifunctional UDP-sugar hydrolase/5'-nucleotidase [Eubacteriales bacterium]|nr:bifunctional UDP-sugar hydrolase/5'-nucleotidase [Eubacteriales bacterium]